MGVYLLKDGFVVKDYITIIDEEDKAIKMELVTTFRLELSDKDCIIYKSLNDDK